MRTPLHCRLSRMVRDPLRHRDIVCRPGNRSQSLQLTILPAADRLSQAPRFPPGRGVYHTDASPLLMSFDIDRRIDSHVRSLSFMDASRLHTKRSIRLLQGT